MVEFKRRRISSGVERSLLIGSIISNVVCREVISRVNISAIDIDYVRVILRWIRDYYSVYKEAPRAHIQNIFDKNKGELKSGDKELIEKLLAQISDQYEATNGINEQYLISESIKYIEECNLRFLAKGVEEMLDQDRHSDANALVANYKKIAATTSKWVNPFTPSEINKAMDMRDDIVFQYPGPLGQLSGPLLRNYFVAVLGPIKKGKTWWMMDLAILVAMQKRNVVFFSFEIDEDRMKRRFYQNIIAFSKRQPQVIYPRFDCLLNQVDECDLAERTCKIALRGGDDKPVHFKDTPKSYKICTYCRDHDGPGEYIQETWFEQVERPTMGLGVVRKKTESFVKMYGDRLRLKAYPRFSAGMNEVESDLDVLQYTEGFTPDMIITDYADIMQRPSGEFRHAVDELWMHHARLASERKAVVVTATQAARKSWDRANVGAADSSENYRNPAHVDLMYTLNQTREEKLAGVMRIGVCAARDEEFNELAKVVVLQQLGVGKPLLDAEFERRD